MIKKTCQIYTSLPITCFNIPIIGNTELDLTSDEIYKCLCSKAEVIEILKDGSKVNLDFSNYDKDNNITIKKEVTIAPNNICEKPIVTELEEDNVVDNCDLEYKIETETMPIDYVSDTTLEISENENVVNELDIDTTIKEESDESKESASTVKNYKVASRNNNNHKKNKNNKK